MTRENSLDRLDVEGCRRQFPSLERQVGGQPAVFFDGPAGTQVPRSVADAVAGYLLETNANSGGVFATSLETEALVERGLEAARDFVGGDDAELLTFGPNMTTLTFALSRALARTWGPGDEIIVTQLDHDANFTPWILAAMDAGATVHKIRISSDDCTLDLEDFESRLSSRTRLVAFGAASNAVGTVNPVRRLVDMAHATGALTFVDAVHSAPHRPIDVEAWDCDFVCCSSYKFFGPHAGILWGRRDLLEELPVYKLRPASDRLPGRWLCGTENFECIAGTVAAIDYLADIGRSHGAGDVGRRAALLAAYAVIDEHERRLATRLVERLSEVPVVRIWGITDPNRFDERVSTFGLTHHSANPETVCRHLAARGIFAWHGNFYALPVTEALGLEPDGLVRVGLLHYNTADEVDRLVDALRSL